MPLANLHGSFYSEQAQPCFQTSDPSISWAPNPTFTPATAAFTLEFEVIHRRHSSARLRNSSPRPRPSWKTDPALTPSRPCPARPPLASPDAAPGRPCHPPHSPTSPLAAPGRPAVAPAPLRERGSPRTSGLRSPTAPGSGRFAPLKGQQALLSDSQSAAPLPAPPPPPLRAPKKHTGDAPCAGQSQATRLFLGRLRPPP